MSDERTASDVLVDRLVGWGVDTIFGLPGDGINGLMEALRRRRDDIRYIHVRHEEVAAMAAVGYAKFTGKLGVCFATAAPGAVHLMNGLLDARLEQAPILAISGMTYHDLIGTSYLQDVNIDYLVNDVALYNQRIMGPQHVTNVVDYAVRTALTDRGPSHLAFPIDFQAAPGKHAVALHLGRWPGNTHGRARLDQLVVERKLEQLREQRHGAVRHRRRPTGRRERQPEPGRGRGLRAARLRHVHRLRAGADLHARADRNRLLGRVLLRRSAGRAHAPLF